MASSRTTAPPADDNSTFRSVVSLFLLIHLICVGIVLSSNFRRSRLQSDLVRVFAPYTQFLHFDPDFTPYFYTLGRVQDDDAWLTVDLYASADQPVSAQSPIQSVKLPDGGSNLLGNRRRYFRLAQYVALNADQENENDDATGEIARSVGARLMRESQAKRSVVRCTRRFSQPFNLATLNPGFPPERPTDRAYEQTVYEADVWMDEDNQVQVLKRASRAEVAPRQSPTTQKNGSTPNQPEKPAGK